MKGQAHASYSALSRQSLARPLTAAETALADALERIFAAGTHDFAAVANELQRLQIARPSGGTDAWTVQNLERELVALNAALDDSYARDGIGA